MKTFIQLSRTVRTTYPAAPKQVLKTVIHWTLLKKDSEIPLTD